jgi:hypothetical protein
MRKEYGQTVREITRLLDELGPMTTAELCRELGETRMYVSSVVARMRKVSVQTPKRVYISAYVDEDESSRKYPRAVYALGDAEDAKRKPYDVNKYKREYNARKRKLNTTNSVFNLALTRKEFRI